MLSYPVYVGWRLTRRNRKSSAKNQASPLKFLLQEALADFSADFLPGTFQVSRGGPAIAAGTDTCGGMVLCDTNHTKRIFKLMFGTV